MVQEQNLTNEKQILDLVSNRPSGITANDIKSWKSGVSTPSDEQLGLLVRKLLKSKRLIIRTDDHDNALAKAVRAKQLNTKLMDDASGTDSVLHEVIDESLSDVLRYLS